MGRAWRIGFEGARYHVMPRGNEGKDIFVDRKDRKLFYKALGEISERFETDIFAHVLMDNHASSFEDKENRDILICMLWKTGTEANSEIGDQFGINYFSVSTV